MLLVKQCVNYEKKVEITDHFFCACIVDYVGLNVKDVVLVKSHLCIVLHQGM